MVTGERTRLYSIVLLVILAIAVGAGVVRYPDVDHDLIRSLPGRITGNGFTTSATCQACHPAEYDTWHRSYHRTMTQVATAATVLGDFDDVVLEDRGFRWRLYRQGEELWVQMPDPVWFEQPSWLMQALDPTWPDSPPQIDARVIMTTGSHHMQNYWTRRPRSDERSLGPDNGALLQIPWVWLIDEARWVPNQDSFITPPSGSVGGIATWNANCSQCHSIATEPRTSESYDEFETRSVELGIACEACHGPAERHVNHYRSPVRRYLRYLRQLRSDAPDSTIVNPAKLEQRRSVEVCGQCHSFGAWRDEEAYRTSGIPFRAGQDLESHRTVFRYTQYRQDPQLQEMLEADPQALESRFWADGTIRVAGREYNGLLEDVHFSESKLTCLTCHSMHEYQTADTQLHPNSLGNRSCLGCHEDYAGAVSAHTRHEPASSGSECMNCHMPHTTYGLFSAIRSHRIDSPNVLGSVYGGRPNACNLCHLDQTLEWSGRYLNEWYGQPLVELDEDERSIAGAALWTLKGDAVQRTILAWHLGWEPAREASGDGWIAPYLAQLLTDSYSATRQVAYRSIAKLPGFRGFAYDYVASPPELGRKADEALRRWVGFGGPRVTGARLLIGADGQIDLDEWRRLLGERNETPLTIKE
jgi:hypothetical protein